MLLHLQELIAGDSGTAQCGSNEVGWGWEKGFLVEDTSWYGGRPLQGRQLDDIPFQALPWAQERPGMPCYAADTS